jgi:hypothetical protein
MTASPGAVSVLLALSLVVAAPAAGQDLDRDGLSDSLEQALLERFLPTFVLSAGECDGLPAAMLAGTRDPRVALRDGTIYGHVTPRQGTPERAEIEIKYFHLWSRDCGRPSHALDVEHVSALVHATSLGAPAEAWEAEYWYAAAHAGTVCDASSGALADTLRAAHGGPYVYVSRGKHASYLVRGHCKWGCGSDICDPGGPLAGTRVINVGEPEAPLNGATWLTSGRWRLAARLSTDFDPALRSRLDGEQPATVQVLTLALRPWQAPILGGDTGLDALIMAGDAAAGAVASAAEATSAAGASTGRAVGAAVGKTVRGLAWFLRLK